MVKNGFPISKERVIIPYEIRVKGLSEQLTKEKFSIAMTSIVKHRGISYGLEDSEDSKKSETEYKKSVNINKKRKKHSAINLKIFTAV